MKPNTTLIVLFTFIILLSFKSKERIIQQTPKKAITAVPLYRLLDPNGYHFYTSNETEKNSVIRDLGFVYEDVIGYIFPQQVAGSVPLYRYRAELNFFSDYNSDKPMMTARHFYTTNQKDKELDFTVYGEKKDDKYFYFGKYISEGIQGYISTTQVAGTTPIYQVFQYKMLQADGDKLKTHPGAYDWFFTNNEAEKFSAINKYGYKDKGIAGYLWTSAVIK